MSAMARWLLALAVACAAGTAPGSPGEWPDALSARVQHIKETRVVRLGYRDSVIPFSYAGPDGSPVGYSIDLCRAIVATLAVDLGVPELGVRFVRVTAQDRIERVASGAVDFECGSTTNTAERRREVAFSPVIFITGTRVAVPRDSAVRGVADLAGQRVVVVGGTTVEKAIRETDRLRGLRSTIVLVTDYPDALALLASRRADALAADEVLLRGLLVETGRTRDFRIVGELLSFEPYGITYPLGEPALADAVERSFRSLAESRGIVWIYDRWFVRPLPTGGSVGMPMNIPLRRSFELLGLPPE